MRLRLDPWLHQSAGRCADLNREDRAPVPAKNSSEHLGLDGKKGWDGMVSMEEGVNKFTRLPQGSTYCAFEQMLQ